MKRRMFRYPCSFLIDSPAFDAMPPMLRDRIYRRLLEVLTGADQTPVYARLTAADRRAILEICWTPNTICRPTGTRKSPRKSSPAQNFTNYFDAVV